MTDHRTTPASDGASWPIRWRQAAALLISLLAACGGSDDPAAPDPTLASTDKGAIRGKAAATGLQFLGIPYAAAPVDALRWQPPQPVAAWASERSATAYANHCAQPGTPFGTASMSEDCLYLNVFRPTGDGPFPVMVWVHGGALWLGQGDEYDPAALVAKGIVVVTINYRLGILGFLSHPALSAESIEAASGNYGLMDQQAALHWVRDNIKAFGGDPANVTLFGQSGGGLSVSSQLVSPGASGLFHKAIIQSGAYSLNQPSLATAEAAGQAFAVAANCADQSAACLRSLSVSQLLTAQGFRLTGFVPTVEGHVLPRTVRNAFASGNFHRLPVMTGSTGNEFSLISAALFDLVPPSMGGLGPVTDANYAMALPATLGAFEAGRTAAQTDAAYAGAGFASAADAIDAIGTDSAFACPARDTALKLSAFTPVYAYEFNDPNAPMGLLPPVRAQWGSYHAAELQFLFGVPVRAGATPAALTAGQQRLATELVELWTQFARTGTPGNAGTTAWPQFTVAGESVLSLETAASRVVTDFAARHRCQFWTAI